MRDFNKLAREEKKNHAIGEEKKHDGVWESKKRR